MSARKFYKQTFTITVLSEDVPLEYDDLADIAREIDTGDCVGSSIGEVVEEITAEQAADLLIEYGSDPGFFQLDDEGEDVAGDPSEPGHPDNPRSHY